MIVTKNSFVAYQLLPGTMSLQLANFFISIFTILTFPDAIPAPNVNLTFDQYWYSVWGITGIHFMFFTFLFLVDVMKIKVM
jgi:hypothetical protein